MAGLAGANAGREDGFYLKFISTGCDKNYYFAQQHIELSKNSKREWGAGSGCWCAEPQVPCSR